MFDYDNTIADKDVEADPRRALMRAVTRGLSGDSAPAQAAVHRITVEVDEPADPLRWLQAQSHDFKFYWMGRRRNRVVAAAGTADVVSTDAHPSYDTLEADLEDRLRDADPGVHYLGGLRFDARLSDGGTGDWSAFGAYRFVLPRFELSTADGRARLTCNLVLPRDAKALPAIRTQIEQLAWPGAGRTPKLPQPIGRRDAPGRGDWIEMIESALTSIRAGALDKVVLARRATFAFEDALDPFVLLQHLQAATPGCFHFGIQPTPGKAFVGASPERLFRLSEGTVQSEAIAGTRSRGDSAQADAALRDELLDSEKDRREHAFVQTAIRNMLAPLCTKVTLKEAAAEMRLTRGRHLRSRFQGQLRDDASPIDLLRALHPTPAVGGAPTDQALDFIRQAEPFDRGWYAGPVGWVGRDAAEFAVALRCGRVAGSDLALYSGAGIVDGSVPAQEWAEIEQKISDFAAVLDLNA